MIFITSETIEPTTFSFESSYIRCPDGDVHLIPGTYDVSDCVVDGVLHWGGPDFYEALARKGAFHSDSDAARAVAHIRAEMEKTSSYGACDYTSLIQDSDDDRVPQPAEPKR